MEMHDWDAFLQCNGSKRFSGCLWIAQFLERFLVRGKGWPVQVGRLRRRVAILLEASSEGFERFLLIVKSDASDDAQMHPNRRVHGGTARAAAGNQHVKQAAIGAGVLFGGEI